MGIFTAKEPILVQFALIGTDNGHGGIDWDEVDMEYAWDMFRSNVLEDRGTLEVNGILYRRFYLPGPNTV